MNTALVTGASSGIGLAVVDCLARKGMTVYLGSRTLEAGREALRSVVDSGDVRLIHLDLLEEDGIRAAVAEIGRNHDCLDLLVNNAGTPLRAETAEEIGTVFQIHLHGPMRLTQLAVPLLRRSAAGQVINVSSAAGQFSFMAGDYLTWDPETLHYAYPVSKTALNAATVLMANALRADGVRVNAWSPGLVSTKISGMQGKSPEKAAAALVAFAMQGADGPTGGFFDSHGPIEW